MKTEQTSEQPKPAVGSSDWLCVTVAGGKYTVIQDSTGRLKALRYGEEWRDCCGDNLIYNLAYELQELRREVGRDA